LESDPPGDNSPELELQPAVKVVAAQRRAAEGKKNVARPHRSCRRRVEAAPSTAGDVDELDSRRGMDDPVALDNVGPSRDATVPSCSQITFLPQRGLGPPVVGLAFVLKRAEF
jgi:hypothetical protein